MSSLTRMLSVLDLFTQDRATWSAEEVAQQLDCSIPTAYRYLRELTEAQLLRAASTGRYVLGNRIVELDYQLRSGDPLIQASAGPMKDLAQQVDCDVALVMLSGDHVLTIQYESHGVQMRASYGRGRRMPTFKGAMSLAVLSSLSKPRLRKLMQKNAAELDGSATNDALETLSQTLKLVRKQGYATSLGALDPHNAGIAIALEVPDQSIYAGLGLVMSSERFRLLETEKAAEWLKQCSKQICHRLEIPPARYIA
ncbi:HTH domain-containing protein [Bordetella avium]|nr:HTH domain-containing protein [Bordetella avium]RIQ54950.1 HTH domain-containing protein [Bordetella avium]RIQ63761.1 HTH domain-containing protein [Bordetella avium]RIQ64071.1 HTH domain-containing protein [Bordetella avium]RIQ82397.1 HTH domain-containing protein [Bordetella avium]